MSKARLAILCVCCSLGALLPAQTRKPGLWELTTTQTWQQSPFPSGAAPGSGPRTTKVCLTQEQIDKYGAIVPQSRGCQITNIVKKGNGMTADMVCSGTMSGKGTMESTAVDGEHAKGKVHFVGSIQAGGKTMPIEWTTDSSSVFKSPDCGDVKPVVVPDK